jgi:predicted dehydrogenase
VTETGRTVRWGIIGTGGIASTFARELVQLPGAELVAVGSRRSDTAEEFGQRFDVPRRHGSYESLVADYDVDAVYVSTPHPGHYAASRLALEAGCAVLCEKPFTMNADEAAALVGLARERNLFLMEAMWTRFLPTMVKIRELLGVGAIGEVVTVLADHAQWFEQDAEHRLFAPSLGGGALLDLGVYPVSFASMVLGTPSSVTAVSDPAFTGVDGQTSILMRYPGGQHAVVTTTLRAAGVNRAAIVGTEGRIEVDPVWYSTNSFTLTSRSGAVERLEFPKEHKGMRHEAAEVVRCLREGLSESAVMPLDETVEIMRTLDEVRRQIGLVYQR